jgi:hypothetical protein
MSARPSNPRRRLLRWTIVLVALLLLLSILVPRLAAPYVRGKLQKMIAAGVDAELRMDDLVYLPPFGVRVKNARLVAQDTDGSPLELLKIARVDLKLAKLPFGDGPLVIQRIEVDGPEVHLIRTQQGLLAVHTFRHEPKQRDVKLSDMFELRHFALRGGRVLLEDRTSPGSVPMVWSNLSASSETTQTSRSSYKFDLKAEHTGVASFAAAGTFDLDERTLSAQGGNLTVSTDPAQQTSGLPAQIQSVLRDYQVAGRVEISGSGDVSFRHPADASYDVRLEVKDARTKEFDHLAAVVHAKTTSPSVAEIQLEKFEATSRVARVTVGDDQSKPLQRIDRAAHAWSLSDLRGKLTSGGALTFDVSANGPLKPPAGQKLFQAAEYRGGAKLSGVKLQPPKFPLPLEEVAGTVELRRGVVAFNNISARYGQDKILLRSARVPIPDDPAQLARSLPIEEINGRIDFKHPNSPYPSRFGKVVEKLRPAGAFEIGGGGYFRVDRIPPAADGTPPPRKHKADWFFGISSDAGSFTVTDKDITLANIKGDATVSNLLIDVARFDCQVFGGTAQASGKIVPKKPYFVENASVSLREVDLAAVGKTLKPEKANDKLVGRAFLNLTFAGSLGKRDEITPANALTGRGEFEVLDGNFWTLPVLGEVAGSAGKSNNSFTLGEAAGVFRVSDRTITLEEAAINSSALGLVGSGTIGFDKSIDLRIVAAPLGDWRERARQTGIPIVSNAAGEVFAAVQKLLNAATGTMLYQFRATGTVAGPKVETIPAPAITEPVATLFGQMLDDKRKAPLIDSVRGRK